jgi:hypothetical protein
MVTFAREQVLSAKKVEQRFGVSDDTLRRWFRSGLDHIKRGRKVFTSLEALDRFFGNAVPLARGGRCDAAFESLERAGVNTGRESVTDGKSKRGTAA